MENGIYLKLRNMDLILFSIYRVRCKKETCTFERVLGECFTNFPKTFGFLLYPQWPDATKLDRALRDLRKQKLIEGGMGGKSSAGLFSLTKKGCTRAREAEAVLKGRRKVSRRNVYRRNGRSIDEKLVLYLKRHVVVNAFLNDRENFELVDADFRHLLKCTTETPTERVKESFDYFQKLVKDFKLRELEEFFDYCKDKFIS